MRAAVVAVPPAREELPEVRTWKTRHFPTLMSQEPPLAIGRVLAVPPSKRYTIVSLGMREDIRRGDQLVVARGHRYVATVRVLEVWPTESDVEVLPDTKQAAIEVGDRVIAP